MDMIYEDKIAIAYNTDSELDTIKKYYSIRKHYRFIGMVLVNDRVDNARNLLTDDKPKEDEKEDSIRLAPLGTTYTVDFERVADFALDNYIHQQQQQQQQQYVPQLTYVDTNRIANIGFAIDEIARQTGIAPCGDSNVIFVFDTGINNHEAFTKGFEIHLSDTYNRFKAEGLVERYSVVGGDGSDDHRTHGHGTPVTYLTRMFAPNADIFSIKVIKKVETNQGPTWQASDEEILDGFEQALTIINNRGGKHSLGPPYLVEIYNLSFGGEPTATPPPLELAIENISKRRPQSLFISAAGNMGPSQGTILTPAQSPWCIAIGSCDASFYASYYSSRGPTRGIIKPEYLFFGSDIVAASMQSERAYASFTGTSFAAPLVSGGLATTISGAIFTTPQVQDFLKEFDNMKLDIKDIINLVGTKITVKPRYAPDANLSGKDNTYGWGIPQGDRIASIMGFVIQQIQRPISFLDQTLNTILGVGVISAFAGTVIRQTNVKTKR